MKRTLSLIWILLLPTLAHSQWAVKTPMPTPRYGIATVAINNHIYVMGGTASHFSDSYDLTERYDIFADTWSTDIAPMQTARRNAAAAVLDGLIYVFGGKESYQDVFVADVERYNPQTNSWEVVSTMPFPRDGCVAVAAGEWIYLIGGAVENQQATDRFERYRPSTGDWEVLPSLNQARTSAAFCALDEMIYIIGGFAFGPLGSLESIIVSDGPISAEWTTEDVQITPRGYLGAGFENDSLVVVGGSNSQGELDIVELMPFEGQSFQPAQDFDPLGQARDGLGVVAIDQAIYAIGGRMTQGVSKIPVATVEMYNFIPPNAIDEPDIDLLPKIWLGQNYPNPFTTHTWIPFQIPVDNQAATLRVFSLAGQLIWESDLPSKNGEHRGFVWNGENWQGAPVAGGTYVYQLATPDTTMTGRMIKIQ